MFKLKAFELPVRLPKTSGGLSREGESVKQQSPSFVEIGIYYRMDSDFWIGIKRSKPALSIDLKNFT